MNRELELLKTIQSISPNNFVGDDCAYIPEYNLAISTDCLIEDVHFSFSYMTPFEVARKALLANVSDILAAGAKPAYYSIALAGRLDCDFVQDFYKGLNSVSGEYRLKLTGGDLSYCDKVTISITILGDTKGRRISSRKNAKAGYVVATKGNFGSSAQGLEELKKENNSKSNFANIHKNPVLYPELSEKIATCAQFPYAMMDSSDGLCDCLYKISEASNVKISIEYSKIPHETKNRDYVLFGGEDYLPVVCLDLRDFEKIKDDDFKIIGTIEKGEGVYLDFQRLEYRAFEHF